MKNWSNFFESKLEKEEEKTGLDLDHDKESKESVSHKKKITEKHKELVDFFTTRMNGAKKIESDARSKGGPSLLTAWHFAQKTKSYKEILDYYDDNKDKKFFISKCRSIVSQIRFENITQKRYQELLGELECWGEAVIKIFNAQ